LGEDESEHATTTTPRRNEARTWNRITFE
jgi:hypothetical protein